MCRNAILPQRKQKIKRFEWWRIRKRDLCRVYAEKRILFGTKRLYFGAKCGIPEKTKAGKPSKERKMSDKNNRRDYVCGGLFLR